MLEALIKNVYRARNGLAAGALRAGTGFLAGAAGYAGFAPLALPVAAAAWFSEDEPYPMLAGALIGTLAAGNGASFIACALFAGAELISSLLGCRQRGSDAVVRRLVFLALAGGALVPVLLHGRQTELLLCLVCLASSPIILMCAVRCERALRRYMRGRPVGRRGALALALSLALAAGALFLAPAEAVVAAAAIILVSSLALARTHARSAELLYKTRKRLRDAAGVTRSIAELFCADEDALSMKSQLDGLVSAMEHIALDTGSEGKRRFSLSLGTAAAAKPGSPETGDAVAMRRAGDELLLILGDGMGSGCAAHRESAGAAALIGDMLSIGFKNAEAGESVNGLLLLGDEEIFTTLDVARVDLVTGETELLKFGAPPAYILRRGNVLPLESPAPPAGILREARPGGTSATLRRDDALIMMTDGLYDALGMELYASIIDRVGAANTAQDAADALIRAGLERGHDDDMSVIVARVAGA